VRERLYFWNYGLREKQRPLFIDEVWNQKRDNHGNRFEECNPQLHLRIFGKKECGQISIGADQFTWKQIRPNMLANKIKTSPFSNRIHEDWNIIMYSFLILCIKLTHYPNPAQLNRVAVMVKNVPLLCL
jgi:hypothetical protein